MVPWNPKNREVAQRNWSNPEILFLDRCTAPLKSSGSFEPCAVIGIMVESVILIAEVGHTIRLNDIT